MCKNKLNKLNKLIRQKILKCFLNIYFIYYFYILYYIKIILNYIIMVLLLYEKDENCDFKFSTILFIYFEHGHCSNFPQHIS